MKCGPLAEEFVIPSRTTQVRHFDLPEGPIVASGRAPLSCEIVSDGAVDALRPVGSVTAPGYSAPVRFYDPKTATFPSLTAVGLETTAETHVTIHNVTDTQIELTPILREAALVKPYTQNLAARMLAPHGSTEIDIGDLLRAFQAKSILPATLTLESAAPKGALVGSVTQISSPDRLVEDIPLRTSNPPAFARGSYPLRWDEDYTNLVTVTNTAEETLRIGGEITAGEVVYVLTRTDIDPGATIVFDVDQFKRDAVPDVNGKTIPKTAPYGKIHWIEMSNGKKAGLLGRTSLSSVRNKRKSSFSCGSTCQYYSQQSPFYDCQVFTSLLNGGTQVSNITEYDSSLNGGSYAYPIPYSGTSVSMSTPSIASSGPDNSTYSNIVLYGNSPGITNVDYQFYDLEYSYDPFFESCNSTDNGGVQYGSTSVQVPDHLSVQSDSSATINCGSAGFSDTRTVYYNVLDINNIQIQAFLPVFETTNPNTSNSCNGSPLNITYSCTATPQAGVIRDTLPVGCPSSAQLAAQGCGFTVPDQKWEWCGPSFKSIGDIGALTVYNNYVSLGGNSTGFAQGTTFPHQEGT